MNNKNIKVDDDLFFACQEGLQRKFDSAVKAGANINACDYFSMRRPIHVAVLGNNLKIVAKLLKFEEIEVDVLDCECWTPLDIARKHGYQAIASLLEPYVEKERQAEASEQRSPTRKGRARGNAPPRSSLG